MTQTKTMKNALVALFLALVMALSLFGIMTLTASAADGIAYVDYTWDEESGKLTSATESVTEYTAVTETTTAWTTGWYVVSGDVTVTERIAVSGDVHLVLTDGCTLTAEKGITVTGTDSLTIYGQANSSGKLTAMGEEDCAGIGGGDNGNGGSITVNGGTVTANSGTYGAGIGGGDNGNGGSITVNGGTVTANSGTYGAGIGGGYNGNGGSITINGGAVTATTFGVGAAIGGGYQADGGNITVNGGTIIAKYNELDTNVSFGAGIGGGYKGGSGTIEITGGDVTASGYGGAAGIGGRKVNGTDTVTIRGGTVTATSVVDTHGESGAGIGGETGCDEVPDIAIYGGTVTATGAVSAAGIGGGRYSDGGKVYIYGGTVTARGGENAAGIGGGRTGNGGEVYIYGGYVEAVGGYNGAGIGGGAAELSNQFSLTYTGAGGGTVTVSGGTVKARGGENAAGIGGGGYQENSISGSNTYYRKGGAGASVTVTGGNVYAVGDINAEAIGHGAWNTTSGTLTNGSENVRLVTVKLNSSGEISVSGIDAPEGYGLTDVETIGNVLYLYVPESVLPSVITAEDGTQYMGMASFDSTATFVAHTHNQNKVYYECTEESHTLVTACENCPIDYTVKGEAQDHSWAYTAVEHIIYEKCSVCDTDGGVLELGWNTDNHVYDGNDKRVNIRNFTLLGKTMADVDYRINGALGAVQTINAGLYTATAAVGGAKATMTYEILKATPSYTTPTGLAATYGDTLADIQLPQGFSWQAADTTLVGNAGNNTFLVTFTPEDVNNYNTVTDIEVTVAVGKKTVTVTAESKEVEQFTALPEFTYTVDGMLDGDEFTTAPVASVTISDTNTFGEYEITVSGGEAGGNYEIEYVGATLTVSAHTEHRGGTATCTNKAVCGICGAEYGEPLGHTEEAVNGKAATCTEAGLTDGKKCSVCDEILTAQTEIPATGHAYDHACDTTCNTCGEERTPAEHIDADENNACDECGAELPKDGLSGGAIAGIAVGSVVVAGVGGFSLLWFVIKKKKWADLIAVFKK